MSGPPPAPGPRPRVAALDYLKAAAIVAVVFTHSGASTWAPKPGWDGLLTRSWVSFHVPSFLFASGFLYASLTPIAAGTIGRRLLRVLVPYLVASAVAVASGAASKHGSALAVAVASGGTLGIYYYVFLIAVLIPLVWPLSRLPRWVPVLLALYSLAVLLWPWRFDPHLSPAWGYWAMRDPLRHFVLGYFLVGWLAAVERRRLAALLTRYPMLWLAASLAGVAVGLAFGPYGFWPRLPAQRVVYSFGVIGLVAWLARGRSPGRLALFLSEASLGLYLFHKIVQMGAPHGWLRGVGVPGQILARVALGLGGAALLLLAGRGLLGRERARRWLGA